MHTIEDLVRNKNIAKWNTRLLDLLVVGALAIEAFILHMMHYADQL
jgi:hypothetical protein